jgi:predicted ATPase/class 3 adenylate cyclase
MFCCTIEQSQSLYKRDINRIAMHCPHCQTSNPPNAKFCMECGQRLLVCPDCRTANLSNAKFCIECGTSLLVTSHAERETVALVETGKLVASSALPLISNQPSEMLNLYTNQLTAPEERRVVTIMFADITGSTPLAARLDPEDMRALLASYFNLMTEQIHRHGGTVEKYIGDAVMAVFGAPVAHEDDPDRAIRAALDMQAALKHFNTLHQTHNPDQLQMRIGVNTGEVAAPGAQFARQDFLITGDAVNMAARLQQVAAPDTILVGERTYLTTREVFEFHSLAPLQVKGKTTALNAWVVLGLRSRHLAISQHPRGIEGLQTSLVGRSLELTLMHATYARVRDARHSHVITLLGSPGVGKSRLIREFIEREIEAARCTTCEDTPIEPRVLQGRCPPYGEGITYWPLVEILRSLIQVREGESGAELEARFLAFVRETLRRVQRSENIEPLLGVLLQRIGRGLRGDPNGSEGREIQRSKLNKETDKGRPEADLQHICRLLLEAMAQVQPLIVVIDDLHWADEAFLDLLEYLSGRITDFPILFIFLARPDFLEQKRAWGGGRPSFTTIILDALTRDETSEMIRELLATHELPDVVLHTIQKRAEGNPFFVEEIVRMLIDQGVLVKEEGTWGISEQNGEALSDLASLATPPEDTLIDHHYILPLPYVPDTIQGVLAARVDLLSQLERQVLQAASIVGRTFWASAILELAEKLDPAMVLHTLEQLVRRDFIETSDPQTPSPVKEEQSFSFKHILIRDVVYQNIPRIRRSQKHTQLALWLEKHVAERVESFAELLAYHYQQALVNWSVIVHIHPVSPENDELESTEEENPSRRANLTRSELVERTIHYLTLAGDRAYRSYYTLRSIQAYTEALNLLQENEANALAIAKMHQKIGHAYSQRFNAREAWNAYIQALKLMKEQPEVARDDLISIYMYLAELATRWLCWPNIWLDTQQLRLYIDEGLKLTEGQAPGYERSAFLTYLALWYMRQIRYTPQEQKSEMAENALQCALEARRIAEEINDLGALWIALDSLGFVYDMQHKYIESHIIQHQRQKMQNIINEREELYDLYMSLGRNHEHISDYPTAAKWFGQAWSVAQTMESPSMLLESMYARLIVWYEWNRWDEACEVAKNLLQTSEHYQQEEKWLLHALVPLAELAYRVGSGEISEQLLYQYRSLYEQKTTEPLCWPNLYIACRDWTQALADLREQAHLLERFPSPRSLSYQAELTVLAGEPMAEQATICEHAIKLSQESGARKFLGIALRTRGRMHLEQSNLPQAESDFRQALEIFQTLDLPWEQGETLTCLGHLHQHQTNPHLALARLYFEQALGFFESLHAVYDVRRVRETLY